MLKIEIPDREIWNSKTNTFSMIKGASICLEHSLVSISKWESKYHKPFISKDQKTREEIVYYIKCMTITQNVKDEVYSILTNQNMEEITKYIEDPMTATKIEKTNQSKANSQFLTSELIYYYMVAYQIPFECQRWNLNRLFVLINICNEKNKNPKKYSKKDILSRNAALNKARREKLGTKG